MRAKMRMRMTGDQRMCGMPSSWRPLGPLSKARAPSTSLPTASGRCQLRSGSAFGITVVFPTTCIEIKSGSFDTYTYQTENDTNLKIRRCTECGTSIFWELDAERFKGMIATAGGTFDPPMPWTQVDVEFFTRSKATFCSINAEESFAESPHYKPIISEDSRLDGS